MPKAWPTPPASDQTDAATARRPTTSKRASFDPRAQEWLDWLAVRPLTKWLAPRLPSWMTPNSITICSGLMVFPVLGLTFWGTAESARSLIPLIIGVVIFLDCLDGEVARVRHSASKRGEALDGWMDAAFSLALIVALWGQVMPGLIPVAMAVSWINQATFDRLRRAGQDRPSSAGFFHGPSRFAVGSIHVTRRAAWFTQPAGLTADRLWMAAAFALAWPWFSLIGSGFALVILLIVHRAWAR